MVAATDSPPSVLDSAKVLAWTLLGSDVRYTDRDLLIVGGKPLGAVPRLAICRNHGEKGVLLFHCTDTWEVLGAGYYADVPNAIEAAERRYRGSVSTWHHVA